MSQIKNHKSRQKLLNKRRARVATKLRLVAVKDMASDRAMAKETVVGNTKVAKATTKGEESDVDNSEDLDSTIKGSMRMEVSKNNTINNTTRVEKDLTVSTTKVEIDRTVNTTRVEKDLTVSTTKVEIDRTVHTTKVAIDLTTIVKTDLAKVAEAEIVMKVAKMEGLEI
jgi:hypothetical protein